MKVLFWIAALTFASLAQAQTITTIAGKNSHGYSGDNGPATAAELYNPTGIALDTAGNIYIGDSYNFVIRKISTAGVITTYAGNDTSGMIGDGGPATAAEIALIWQLATDTRGNLFIADYGFDNIRIVYHDTITALSSNFVGEGSFCGDGGPASVACFNSPYGVTKDAHGNLYIADMLNGRIRKVDATGTISTIAGCGCYSTSGDGSPATTVTLSAPIGVAIDTNGNIFIAESDSNRIRKVTPSGFIYTVAGTGAAGYSGDGGHATSAKLNDPTAIAISKNGDLFIADANNNRIRKVTASGIITTVVGNGTPGFSGDGGLATAAEINAPWGIAVDARENLYFTDGNNHRVRKVSGLDRSSVTIASPREPVEIFPNPAIGDLFLNANKGEYSSYSIYDGVGRELLHNSIVSDQTHIDIKALPKGVYWLQLIKAIGTETHKVVKI